MNKFTKLAASLVAASALTMGASSVAFANGGRGDGHGHGSNGNRPASAATHKDDKDDKKDDKAEHHVFDCTNIAVFDAKAQAKLDKINARIAKLEQYKLDNAVELAANPDKLARIDKAIARLHKAVDRVTARIAKVDAFCAAQATTTTAATTTTLVPPKT